MTSRHGPSAGTGLAALTAGAAVLAPYLTVGLEFRAALESQAVMILGATVLLGVVGWSQRGVSLRHLRVPAMLSVGIALWTAAAGFGTAVALARGNDLWLLAGQLLAVGLLPLAALAGLSLHPRVLRRGLVYGIVGATALAVAVHFVHWAASLAGGRVVARLYLPNDVAAVGPILIALLASASLIVAGGRRARLAGWATVPWLAAYAAGSGVRSLWLVALVGVVPYAILVPRPPPWRRPRTWIFVGGAVLALALAAAASHRWWTAPRADVLPASAAPRAVRWTAGSELTAALTGPAPTVPARVYRGRARIRGAGVGTCYLILDWNDAGGEAVVRTLSAPLFPDGRFRTVDVFATAPPGTMTVSLRLSCEPWTRGPWDARWLEVHELGSGVAPLVVAHFQQMLERALSLRELGRRERGADLSLALRWAESAGLLRELREGTLGELLFGHGLGARYRPATPAFDPEQVTEPINYIHNFYLFLPFKLGLVGGPALLSALALFAGYALRRALGTRRHRDRVFHATVFTIWVAYALWAVACPFLIDFRMAPLWGLLVAASVPPAGPPRLSDRVPRRPPAGGPGSGAPDAPG